MKKIAYISTLVLLLSASVAPIAIAANTVVSFVVMNPKTGANVGAGTQVNIFQVNRNDRKNASTNSSGVVSFDIPMTDYVLSWSCNSCGSDYKTNQGTQYLISPQSDGSVKVLSAADEEMKKDSSGNWIISLNLTRTVTGVDPWQLMSKPSGLNGNLEHMYLMTNGKVLVQSRGNGGFEKWWLLTPDLKGSYLNGTWAPAAQPPAGYNPQNVNGAVLHSGNFIIVGGEQNTNAAGAMEENSNQSYIYDVKSDSWSSVPPPLNGAGLWAGIGATPFVALANGLVMVGENGGSTSKGLSAMLYNEVNGTWTLTGTNKLTNNQEGGYTLLQNDKVLNISTEGETPKTAEIYDPTTGLWSKTSDMPAQLAKGEIGPAVTLPNGKVLAMGATGSNFLYDPNSNTWSSAPDFPKLKNGLQPVAADNPAAVLPNGNVLVQTTAFVSSTQNSYWMSPATWYEYDLAANKWISLPNDLISPDSSGIANGTNMLVLPTGQVLVTSEYGQIELYTSRGVADSAWLPKIDSVSVKELSPKTIYTLTGKQLSGLTQGTFWGDEQQNTSNYGLLQIVNNSTKHVFYARVTGYSNTSIRPNSPSSFSFTFDEKVENGPSSIRVIASGVSSAPIEVNISGGVELAPVSNATVAVTATPDSKPKVEKAPTQKKSTITCVKGKITKKVIAVAPTCPAGYKKKG